MSVVSEIIERQEHNKRIRLAKASTYIQRMWGNLSHLWVEKPQLKPCSRCRRSDPIDMGEAYIDRWAIARRRWPMLEPDQISEVVKAGLRAEKETLAQFHGGNDAQGW